MTITRRTIRRRGSSDASFVRLSDSCHDDVLRNARRFVETRNIRHLSGKIANPMEPDGSAPMAATTRLFKGRQDERPRCHAAVGRVALDAILTKLIADAGAWLRAR